MAIEKITSESQFTETTQSGKVIVKFYAEWCGPCKVLSPAVDEAAELHTGVKFVAVDVDEFEEIYDRFDGAPLPYICFLNNGEKVDSFIGNRKENFLKKAADFAA